jgi:hypothetical protein
MASQNLNVSTANSGQGDKLRDAFVKVRQMFHDIYGSADSYTDTLNIGGLNFSENIQDIIGAMVSGNTETNISVTYDDTSGKLNFAVSADIEDVNAGGGLTGVNESGGSATLNVGAGTGITVNTDDVQITDNGVDHQQLHPSYTELEPLGTGSAFALNFDLAATFTAAMDADSIFTLSNAQQGQVIDLIVNGNFIVTFAETGSTFNKVGSTNYDGSTNNIIQIMCTDDTAGAKVYHFAVGTYTSSTTA